ncbi:ABC transporter transmembrane domain-containing protein [Rhizobium sp. F40D2]|uniref:ABC transporter transmembrane domain-containing protein n=1 Tax=Rhizobium sp. F40D2 TaxID=3453141 RepID=UPI003F298416
MPKSLFGFVLLIGRYHQIGIAALSIILFLAGTAPLEIQRRIINAATDGAPYQSILILVLAYLGLVLLEGLTKLMLNIYRAWIGEVAVRWLRKSALAASERQDEAPLDALVEGVQLSIVIAEAEPVGGFVGTSVSEPLLQAGILVAVGGYMIFLQPLMALAVAIVFLPQIGFVPLMQSAINHQVETKITVMRHVSQSMVQHVATNDALDAQGARVERLFSLNMSIYKIKFTMNFMMNLMTQLGYAGIFALGGYYVATGNTEIGTVVAFISGLSKIRDPWGELIDWYRDLRVTQVKYAMIRDASAASGSQDEAFAPDTASTIDALKA